jgi:hypothetical protein
VSPIDALELDDTGTETFKKAQYGRLDRSPGRHVETWAELIRPECAVAVEGVHHVLDLLGRKRPDKGIAVHHGASFVELDEVKVLGIVVLMPEEVVEEGE